MKKTVVLGASPNPSRYAYRAVQRLSEKGHEAIPIGIKKGEIEGIEIINDRPELEEVDTVSLYLRPDVQAEYYDYIFSLNPKRIIFNPGTENPDLVIKAANKGIKPELACTLVMLSTDQY